MKPEAAEALALTLDAVRRTVKERKSRIAGVSDGVLVRALGIANPDLCRRLAEKPRIARRIDPLLAEAIAAEEAHLAQLAAMPAPEPAFPAQDEVPEQEHIPVPFEALEEPVVVQPPPLSDETVHRCINRIAAAIELGASGVLLGRAEIEKVTSRFGEDAVAFALAHRKSAPGWMCSGAGDRLDVLNQFAATAVCCLAAETTRPEWQALAARVADLDPIPVGSADARAGAAVLAEAALTQTDHSGTDNGHHA